MKPHSNPMLPFVLIAKCIVVNQCFLGEQVSGNPHCSVPYYFSMYFNSGCPWSMGTKLSSAWDPVWAIPQYSPPCSQSSFAPPQLPITPHYPCVRSYILLTPALKLWRITAHYACMTITAQHHSAAQHATPFALTCRTGDLLT